MPPRAMVFSQQSRRDAGPGRVKSREAWAAAVVATGTSARLAHGECPVSHLASVRPGANNSSTLPCLGANPCSTDQRSIYSSSLRLEVTP